MNNNKVIVKDELIEYLRQNLNLTKDHYNENTYNWSTGYCSCFLDVVHLIMKYKEE